MLLCGCYGTLQSINVLFFPILFLPIHRIYDFSHRQILVLHLDTLIFEATPHACSQRIQSIMNMFLQNGILKPYSSCMSTTPFRSRTMCLATPQMDSIGLSSGWATRRKTVAMPNSAAKRQLRVLAGPQQCQRDPKARVLFAAHEEELGLAPRHD